MPLIKQILVSGLIDLQNNPPRTQAEAGRRWADMYHSYAQGAVAGPVLPSGLNKFVIQSGLSNVRFNQFFTKGDSAVVSYWSAALWAGPGFVGVTASAAGLGARLASAGNRLKNTDDKVRSANELANAIDLYTRGVSVTTTNVASGVTATVFLT